ncbi:MAG: hypothetical protein Q7S36_01075 [Candidatus Liptonbacteria bacterium]|nr:hypothetical protein [Candidatus Liptonbacteria bacterium]
MSRNQSQDPTKMTKHGKIYVVFACMLFGGYVVYRLVSAAGSPKDFDEARLKGASISQEIVNLSNQLKDELFGVNELDRNGDYTAALTRVTEIAKRTEDIRGKAVELSGELQRMTTSLSKIGSDDAKQAVLESVSNRLALLSRLINYSDYVYQLVSVLRDKFTGNYPASQKVATLVGQINAEVTAINSFNQSAMAAMDRFDKAVQ